MNNQILKSPYPLLDRVCYCCDSHHMKRLLPDLWFYQPGKRTGGTARTVGKRPSNCSPADGWNETLAVCI
jgi:hypothetical protein